VLNDRRGDITPTVVRVRAVRARSRACTSPGFGVATDVAYAAVYLASRESEFVTGVNLQLGRRQQHRRGLTLA